MSKAENMAQDAKGSFLKSVFEKLAAYLKIVLPELEKWQFSDKLELSAGVNVMDLSNMRTETQHLVIASTIERVITGYTQTLVVIPEAWETLSQTRMTPVKWVAQQFIRKGAALGNYMLLDSQDLAGVDKTFLRQCDNWLMGRMKETNEIGRILKQLTGSTILAKDIQTLPVGHFYASLGDYIKKVYVLPSGVPEEMGVRVAKGEVTSSYLHLVGLMPDGEQVRTDVNKSEQVSTVVENTTVDDYVELQERIERLEKEVATLE